MSKEKQIELLEKQLKFWKHQCTILSIALDDAENTAKRATELLEKTEDELNEERVNRGWISVEDRLPDEDVRVLVYLDSERSYTKIDTDRLEDRKFVRWYKDVTHWMYLPEPPKMKGADDERI